MSGTSLVACVHAQVAAEVRTRLRSPATVVAVLAVMVASFLWIPDPGKRAVSMGWETTSGQWQSGLYTSAFLGTASASMAGLFLSLIGFYLVTGSIRRDRESGVGAILAATPITRAAYMAGKLAAHTVYLHAVGLAALASGVIVFLRYGTGPFAPWDFLAPFLVFASPSLLFTAALALFFDATPGLRSRGGLVAYFFGWSFGMIVLPLALHGGLQDRQRYEGPVSYDPTGIVTLTQQIERQPGVKPGSATIGLEFRNAPLERVRWQSSVIGPRVIAYRLVAVAWALLPLGLGVLAFDRFDPARGRPSARRPGFIARWRAGKAQVAPVEEDAPAARVHLEPVHAVPHLRGAVLAEARLVWLTASLMRWPLAIAALTAALPGPAARVGTALFLLLLGPILSEVAARESLAGTTGLVRSQPGVPRSLVLWKTAAVLLFVLALGLPASVRAAVESRAHGVAMVVGLAFVACLAVACGALSGGGKLFAGLYTALWYVSVNGAAPLDYCGAFTGPPAAGTRVVYAGLAVVLVALAWSVERRRTA